MTAPLPNLDDSQVLKALLVALGNITSGGGGGAGNVVGPASSTAGNAAVFASGTGKLLADSGIALTAAAVGFTIAGGTSSKTLTVLNTGTAALLEVANVFTANGAASTPAVTLTGTIFTGGTATSTKPLFLIEPTGTTSNGWSTAGTLLGANLPSGFSGDAFAICSNGFRFFSLRYDSGSGATFFGPPSTSLVFYGGAFYPESDGSLRLGRAGVSAWSGLGLTSGAPLEWNTDTGLARSAAATVKVTNGGAGYGGIDANGYSASGTPGVTAGPFTAITSIEVKNGIVVGLTGT